jgi:hypothetical protein
MQQHDPSSDHVPDPSADKGKADAAASTSEVETSLYRRRAQRRGELPEPEVPAERRREDRRKRKPGLPALLGAILGIDEKEQAPEDQH